MSCIYCGHYILYKLKEGNYKCARCKKKFSPKKIDRKAKILKGFLNQLTPTQIAKKYNFAYASVVNEIKHIRLVMAKICEDKFLENQNVKEFEEYLYIPNKDIYKAQNFLTIDYGYIYNIMLSDMKNYENMNDKEIKSLFLQSRIIKYQNHIKIQQFWDYFEKFMKTFRCVNKNNFFYYLKEAEFRFNKFKIELKDLL
jgi:DNA-directed RNA polymerase subunit RPC12/RpoP